MPNLIHLTKDIFLKLLEEKNLSIFELENKKVKVFFENLQLENDYIAVPFEVTIPLGITEKKINRNFTLSNFEVQNNILKCFFSLENEEKNRLENLIIQLINPVINRFTDEKIPVKIEKNFITINLNKFLDNILKTFKLQLKEVAIFKDEINILFE